MSRVINTALTPYGAFELKARYQRNLLLGDFLMVLIVSATAAGLLLYSAFTVEEAKPEPKQVPIGIFKIIPPPAVIKRPPEIRTENPRPRAIPKGTTPVAVPDDQALNREAVIPTRQERGDAVPSINLDSLSNGGGFNFIDSSNNDEYLPTPTEFVLCEIPPEMIYEAAPDFPRLALLSRQEGVVWIKALVDKNGVVRQALILKSSGLKVGFDEAAVTAAYKCKYKPAVQNGRPIAVWVAYKVEFTLAGRGN